MKNHNLKNVLSNIGYQSRLNRVIPGGAHTYSRGHDQFPSNAPQLLERGEGAYVWDPEGHCYLDYGWGYLRHTWLRLYQL